MNPEIKTRLAQIRAGEIPQGYKRTHTGIVPQNWEIKKMSSVLKKQTQKNRNNAIQNVLTNSATQGIVCQIDYFDKQIANNENTDEYYVVKPGYFVYNPRISVTAPCGPFNRYNGNEDGIMSPLYSIYCFCDKSKTYSDFLTYYFSSSKWYAYMNSIANYGARSDRMNVTKEDMDNMPIPYPPLYEQQRIVAILSTQDRIIELCERKIEQLKRMKKYYLQKMFPKNGEEYPEIRFKGFTDAWEQRKLSEGVSEIGDGLHGTPTYCDDGNVYFINGNNLVNGRIVISEDTKKVDEEQQSIADKSLDNNTILMSINGTIGNLAYYSGEKLMLGKSAAYIKVSEFNKKFVYIYLQTPSIQTYFMDSLTGTTIKNLGLKAIREMTMPIPQDIEEQKQIGEFFDNLDTLITLHQRKCEEEKKKKNALQQLLLTGIVRVKK